MINTSKLICLNCTQNDYGLIAVIKWRRFQNAVYGFEKYINIKNTKTPKLTKSYYARSLAWGVPLPFFFFNLMTFHKLVQTFNKIF